MAHNKHKTKNHQSSVPAAHSQAAGPEQKHQPALQEQSRPAEPPIRRESKGDFSIVPWLALFVAIAAALIYYLQLQRLGDQLAVMQAQQRPWVKISHEISYPLTFNSPTSREPVASIVIGDTLENVGQSVAVNVIHWEDLIPLDPDHSYKTALAGRSQWCDTNRHPNPHGLSGNVLFPKDPMSVVSHVGPKMETVDKIALANIDGTVGFVLVGCVCYRASFEKKTDPTHQTRFLYLLAAPAEGGAVNPEVKPTGTASTLRLVTVPDQWSAD